MTHKGAAQVVKAFEKVNFVVFGRLGKSENLGIFTSKWMAVIFCVQVI